MSISREQFTVLQHGHQGRVGWIILLKHMLTLHSVWGDPKWLRWNTLLIFIWIKCLITIISHAYLVMRGCVYLLWVHHDTLEHSHKESLLSPSNIAHSSREFKNPIPLNCPAVSSNQEDIDQNSSQDFSDWREHGCQGMMYDPSDKNCAPVTLYLSTHHYKTKTSYHSSWLLNFWITSCFLISPF